MIFQRPRDKEGDLATQGYEGKLRTIDLTNRAEGIIASAFYLFPLTTTLSLRDCVMTWKKTTF